MQHILPDTNMYLDEAETWVDVHVYTRMWHQRMLMRGPGRTIGDFQM
jgi:hypothetical protein